MHWAQNLLFLHLFVCVIEWRTVIKHDFNNYLDLTFFFLSGYKLYYSSTRENKKRRFEPVQNSRWLFKTKLKEEAEAPVCIVQVWWPNTGSWQIQSYSSRSASVCSLWLWCWWMNEMGEWNEWMDFCTHCSACTVIWGSIYLKCIYLKFIYLKSSDKEPRFILVIRIWCVDNWLLDFWVKKICLNQIYRKSMAIRTNFDFITSLC